MLGQTGSKRDRDWYPCKDKDFVTLFQKSQVDILVESTEEYDNTNNTKKTRDCKSAFGPTQVRQ